MPIIDYTEFIHNVKQEFITNLAYNKALFPHTRMICNRHHVCLVVERVIKYEQLKLANQLRMLKQNKRVLMKNLNHFT